MASSRRRASKAGAWTPQQGAGHAHRECTEPLMADGATAVCQSAWQRRREGTAEDSWLAVHVCTLVDVCKNLTNKGPVSMCEWLCMQTSPGRGHS